MAKKATPKGKAAQGRVSVKVKHMMAEGMPQKQAVASSLAMERAHRLGRGGQYKPVAKKAAKKR